MQHVSESFRQDEFKGEPAERRKLREHRRVLQNSLVSSFMNYAIPKLFKIFFYSFNFLHFRYKMFKH
ncbi:MAG TPA: palindromic element RPE3 domain-containing protein [Rickettsia endosymbiont of Omalisus fontisbellaquei]|nr:palindromic element RPE3 domain-containing protein [Rickettsia endosymbiont of Omalisus fontisbellaquei]